MCRKYTAKSFMSDYAFIACCFLTIGNILLTDLIAEYKVTSINMKLIWASCAFLLILLFVTYF